MDGLMGRQSATSRCSTFDFGTQRSGAKDLESDPGERDCVVMSGFGRGCPPAWDVDIPVSEADRQRFDAMAYPVLPTELHCFVARRRTVSGRTTFSRPVTTFSRAQTCNRHVVWCENEPDELGPSPVFAAA